VTPPCYIVGPEEKYRNAEIGEKIIRKGGYDRWISVTKMPRYAAKDQTIGTVGMSRDITK